MIEIPNVHRRLGASAGALQRNLEQSRVGFLHAFLEGIAQQVDLVREIDAPEEVPQATVCVRDDREPETEAPQARERR